MSDETDTQAAADAQAATAAAAQAQAAAVDAQAADDAADKSLSPEDARKLRSEAKNLRDRAKTAEDELKKLQDADLSERQKLDRDKTALEAKMEGLETEARNLRAQISAAEVGIAPDRVADAVRLLAFDEIEDANDPKRIAKALRELVKEKPWLSDKPEGLDGGQSRNARQGEERSMTDLLIDAVDRK